MRLIMVFLSSLAWSPGVMGAEAIEAADCHRINVIIDNKSNRSVRVSEFKWMGEGDDKWERLVVDGDVLSPDHRWLASYCIPDVKGKPLFVSVGYAIALDADKDIWSPGHNAQQLRIQTDSGDSTVALQIARRSITEQKFLTEGK